MKKCKLLYLISEDEYFISHKLSQAINAQKNNFEVHVTTHFSKYKSTIKECGFKTHSWKFDRKSINPISNLLGIFSLIKIINEVKPEIIKSFALKPILYAQILSIFFRKIKYINCVVGLGYLFLAKNLSTKIVRKIYFLILLLTNSKKNSFFIFQNNDDLDFFLKNNLCTKSKSKIIRGSGVNTKIFKKKKIKKKFDLILHSRLIEHKGIYELVNVLKILKKKKFNVKVLFLGSPDPKNKTSISENMINQWESEHLLVWKKKVENVVPFLNQSRIAILLSYREGLPKSLIEAASCGLPIITSDVPGCREICNDNYNGYLVPYNNSSVISHTIVKLLKDENVQKKFGFNGLRLVNRYFSDEKICEQFLEVYYFSLK